MGVVVTGPGSVKKMTLANEIVLSGRPYKVTQLRRTGGAILDGGPVGGRVDVYPSGMSFVKDDGWHEHLTSAAAAAQRLQRERYDEAVRLKEEYEAQLAEGGLSAT